MSEVAQVQTALGTEKTSAPYPLLSVIIPVFNERATLEELIQRVMQLRFRKEVLIVDDGSTDGTSEQVSQLSQMDTVQCLFHCQNAGKGAAIRTGLERAVGEIIVIQDADLEYDTAEIEKLIEPIIEGRADVVYGTRFGSGHPNAVRLSRRIANQFLTWLSNGCTGLRLTDMETCYKAFRREAIAGVKLREDRFGFEPEFTAKMARGGWRIMEVPISYAPRSRRDGKKIGYLDGLRAIWCILRYSRWD